MASSLLSARTDEEILAEVEKMKAVEERYNSLRALVPLSLESNTLESETSKRASRWFQLLQRSLADDPQFSGGFCKHVLVAATDDGGADPLGGDFFTLCLNPPLPGKLFCREHQSRKRSAPGDDRTGSSSSSLLPSSSKKKSKASKKSASKKQSKKRARRRSFVGSDELLEALPFFGERELPSTPFDSKSMATLLAEQRDLRMRRIQFEFQQQKMTLQQQQQQASVVAEATVNALVRRGLIAATTPSPAAVGHHQGRAAPMSPYQMAAHWASPPFANVATQPVAVDEREEDGEPSPAPTRARAQRRSTTTTPQKRATRAKQQRGSATPKGAATAPTTRRSSSRLRPSSPSSSASSSASKSTSRQAPRQTKTSERAAAAAAAAESNSAPPSLVTTMSMLAPEYLLCPSFDTGEVPVLRAIDTDEELSARFMCTRCVRQVHYSVEGYSVRIPVIESKGAYCRKCLRYLSKTQREVHMRAEELAALLAWLKNDPVGRTLTRERIGGSDPEFSLYAAVHKQLPGVVRRELGFPSCTQVIRYTFRHLYHSVCLMLDDREQDIERKPAVGRHRPRVKRYDPFLLDHLNRGQLAELKPLLEDIVYNVSGVRQKVIDIFAAYERLEGFMPHFVAEVFGAQLNVYAYDFAARNIAHIYYNYEGVACHGFEILPIHICYLAHDEYPHYDCLHLE
jgi:hypothetical protein